jgi:hypothetical protein
MYLRISGVTLLYVMGAAVLWSVLASPFYVFGQAAGSYTQESMDFVYETTSEYIPLLRDMATRYSVAYEDLHAVMMIECGGCEDAATYVSPQGAVGIMQVKPTSAQSVDSDLEGLPVATVQERLYDTTYNIEVGSRYYAEQYERFGIAELAAAAYNGGPQANEHSAAARACATGRARATRHTAKHISTWEISYSYVSTISVSLRRRVSLRRKRRSCARPRIPAS